MQQDIVHPGVIWKVKETEEEPVKDEYSWVTPPVKEEVQEEEPMEIPKEADPVLHPSHYTQGNIETIDIIRDVTGEAFEGYCVGNIIKYVSRYKHKNGLQDLEKARVYLGWLIDAKRS